MVKATLLKLLVNAYLHCKLQHRKFVTNKKSGVTFLEILPYLRTSVGISVAGYLVKVTQKKSQTQNVCTWFSILVLHLPHPNNFFKNPPAKLFFLKLSQVWIHKEKHSMFFWPIQCCVLLGLVLLGGRSGVELLSEQSLHCSSQSHVGIGLGQGVQGVRAQLSELTPGSVRLWLKHSSGWDTGATPDEEVQQCLPWWTLLPTSQMSFSLTCLSSHSQSGKHTRNQKRHIAKWNMWNLPRSRGSTRKRKQHRTLSLPAQPADQSLQTGPQMSTAGGSWQCTDSCIHWQVAVLKQGVKMPQLCVSGSSAKADTGESLSRASSSQLERHDPTADTRLCRGQGSVHTKINQGFGFSHQALPGEGGQHMPGPRCQLHRRSQPPKALPTPSQAAIPLLLLPMEWHHLRIMAKETQPQTTIWVPDFLGTESLWRERWWQQVWETLNKIRRRAEQRGQNKTWGQRVGTWSPRLAGGQATRCAKNRATLKLF